MTQAVSQRLIREAMARAVPLTADETNAIAVMETGVTGLKYKNSDVDALIAAVVALQAAYDGGTDLIDVDSEMTAASAAAVISKTAGGV